jgi:hypothetical protein
MTANLERKKQSLRTTEAPMELLTAERLKGAAADVTGVCCIDLGKTVAVTVLLTRGAAERFVGAGAIGIGVQLPYLPVIDRVSKYGLALLVQVPREELENYCLVLHLGQDEGEISRRYRVDLASFC